MDSIHDYTNIIPEYRDQYWYTRHPLHTCRASYRPFDERGLTQCRLCNEKVCHWCWNVWIDSGLVECYVCRINEGQYPHYMRKGIIQAHAKCKAKSARK